MSEKQNNDKRWKDELLKSSLPLEQLVSEKLEQNGLHIILTQDILDTCWRSLLAEAISCQVNMTTWSLQIC